MMSDVQTLPDYLQGDAGEELMFDEPAAIASPAPDAAPDAAPPRRARGRTSAAPVAAEAAPIEEPVPPVSDAAAPAAAPLEETAGAAPAPFPPQGVVPAGARPSILLLAVTLFALLTSLVSLGGLIAVGRTLARVETERAHAESERAALAAAPALLARLTQAGARLDTAAQRYAAAAPAGQPATIADVRHELDLLKIALAGSQPQGLAALNSTTHSGLSEIATKLDQIQARLDPKPAH
jgi:hypothetical protein